MSKASGEFLRLQLLIDKGYHPLAYRMMCLQAHYRSELEFSWEGLGEALTRLKRMVMAIEAVKAKLSEPLLEDNYEPKGGWTIFGLLKLINEKFAPFSPKRPNDATPYGLADEFDQSMSSDLSCAIALTVLDEALSLKQLSPRESLTLISAFDSVLGLRLLNLSRADLRIRPKSATITEAEIEATLARRKEARAAKDFATSDALRDQLAAQGVEAMDGDPLGWEWKLGD